MKRTLKLALLTGSLWLLAPLAAGHGGVFRDGPPPIREHPGGCGLGGNPPPVSGGSGTSPGNGAGSRPRPGILPGNGNGGSTGGPARPLGIGLSPGDSSLDLSHWALWWAFNRDEYLDLKRAIYDLDPRTGSDGDFMGRGQNGQARDSLRPTVKQVCRDVVPALLSALERETNNEIVTGSLMALAKIGDDSEQSQGPRIEAVIKSFLADRNQEIRETATIALGVLARHESIATLVHLLDDDEVGRELVRRSAVDSRTRAFAAYGLGLIGARSPIEDARSHLVRKLVASIRNEDTSTLDLRVAAVISIGLIPLQLTEAELPLVGGKRRPAHRDRVGQLEFLLDLLENNDSDSLVRAHVPTALVRLSSSLPAELYTDYKLRIAELLLDLIRRQGSERAEVIQSCLLALGDIGDADDDAVDEEIRDRLAMIVDIRHDPQSRSFALMAMAKAGSRRGNGERSERGAADAAQFLLGQLTYGKASIRPWAGLSIGVMGRRLIDEGFDSVPLVDLSTAVRKQLDREQNPQSVGAYALAAGILGDVEAEELLLEKLAQLRDDDARGLVALALGLGNFRSGLEPIQEIVAESKYRPDLLKRAATALGLLGDKLVVPSLTEMLAEASNLATHAAISSALGMIGDSRSIDPLIVMLSNEELTGSARGFAAVALGIVADKEPLPWSSKIAASLNYRAATPTLTDPASATGILDIL